MKPMWSGHWVATNVDVSLSDVASATGVSARDLAGLALRRNPRRAHLVVSTVLGKHVPTDPCLVYGSGLLLGALVADRLTGRAMESAAERAAAAQRLLSGLAGSARDAARLVELMTVAELPAADSIVVLGYAETATALGHCVAEALGADYLHSTRRRIAAVATAAGFEEEHSHASGHLLMPDDPSMLARSGPVVLVDDELSTGRTALNTIRALNAVHRRSRYVLAALVDLRSTADVAAFAAVAAELDTTIDVVCLAAGELRLPLDVAERARQLADTFPPTKPGSESSGTVSRVSVDLPDGFKDGGRHGFTSQDRRVMGRAAVSVATCLLAELEAADRILVLGSEELMYAPLRIAVKLRSLLAVPVRFSTTTRSPAVAVDEAGYAIRTALSFASHDNPSDGPGPRFAYNVSPGVDPDHRFSHIVLVVDDAGVTPELGDLVAQLASACDRVLLVALPSYRGPAFPDPLRGPAFGSYRAEDVGWLLTDLSNVTLEAPTEEREEAIQSGGAHYAESLPIEFQPDARYQALFAEALTASAGRIAYSVGVLTEIVLAERGPNVVLASLARAGTPIGVLMRRWAAFRHGIDLPHYAVSIVRGRGIDTVALRYLAAVTSPSSVVFVDGWTGKGAIARELADAVAAANLSLGLDFCSDLAVLADPGRCVRTFGARADYLIPSACLNSTVSGLVSRTVLNSLISQRQFHGAKSYSDLAGADVSTLFIDAITAEFEPVRVAVDAGWREVAGSDRQVTWAGWQAVDKISADYGINDVNLVKPGVGETTRVLLRRVPWRILMRPDAIDELGHVSLLAEQRGVEVELVDDLAYSCVGLIHPRFTRGAVGADGSAAHS